MKPANWRFSTANRLLTWNEAEQAKRASEMAKDMRVSADAAEEQAREYRRQVPHGMV